MSRTIYTYTSGDSTLYLIPDHAEIEKRSWHREWEIKPMVIVTTVREEHDQKRYELTPTVVKLKGKPEITVSEYWKPTQGPADYIKAYGPWQLHHRPYGGGRRWLKDDASLNNGIQADKAVDLLIREALTWMAAEHPEWHNLSVTLGWDALIRRQRTEIENAQKNIDNATAEIAKLEILRAPYAEETANA